MGDCGVSMQWDTPRFLQRRVLAEVEGVPARLSGDAQVMEHLLLPFLLS